jgi:putative exosortase-associated protein (TIGR04073 family)
MMAPMFGADMKIWIPTVLIAVLLLWNGTPAWADEPSAAVVSNEEPSVVYQIGAKFVRGAANFATGWVEIPKQIYLVGHNEGWLRGSIKGPIDGLGMFAARTIAGAYEVLTFLFPIPPQYQPMLQPEYVWEPDQTYPVPDSAGQSPDGPPK